MKQLYQGKPDEPSIFLPKEADLEREVFLFGTGPCVGRGLELRQSSTGAPGDFALSPKRGQTASRDYLLDNAQRQRAHTKVFI